MGVADVPPYDTLVRLNIATERLCQAACQVPVEPEDFDPAARGDL
jgi:hypothetical protein